MRVTIGERPIAVRVGENTQSALSSAAAAAASAAAAAASENDAESAASSAAGSLASLLAAGATQGSTFASKAAADTALAGIAANAFVYVLADETRGGRWVAYQKVGGVLSFVAILVRPAITWWVDPVSGNDGSGKGTLDAPFATFTKAVQTSSEGDAIRGRPRSGTTFVRETLNAGAYINRTFDAPGYVFQAYDVEAVAWTFVSGNIWKGTVTHDFGGAGVRDTANANKVYPGLFGGATQFRDLSAGTSPASEAAAVAQLTQANSFTIVGPTVGGAASSRANGWAQGAHTYYVRTDGTDPSTLAWKVQQRAQPVFGTGWTIGNLTVFGGIGHNGVEMMDAEVTGRVEIWLPSCHGQFCCGVQGPGKIVVRGRNPNGSAGYAFHLFNGGAKKRRTILNAPEVHGYNENLDNCFGGHGSNQGNDICEHLEVNDALLVNVKGIGAAGASTTGATYGVVTQGTTFNRLRAFGFETAAWGTNCTVNEPVLVHSGSDSSGPCFTPPYAGQGVAVKGGTVAVAQQGNFSSGSTTGTLGFTDTRFLVSGDRVNGKWWGATAGTWNFTRCLLQGEGASEASYIWTASNGATVTLTDCAVAGLAWPSATTFTRTQRGGHIGLERGPMGEVAAHDNRRIDQALGETVLGFSWGVLDNTGGVNVSTSVSKLFTSKGVYSVGGTQGGYQTESGWWTGIAPYLASILGTGEIGKPYTNPYLFAYGSAGTLIWWQHNNGTGVAPTVVDLSGIGYSGKTITCAVPGPHNGKVLFGCSDGSVFEYDFPAATATARTSGVTFKLTGGVWSGTTAILCGSNASGSTDGTGGGAIVSTDSGATWGGSLVAGDGSTAAGASWHLRVKCAVVVNGVFLLFGSRGCMLSSATGASGSWTVRGLGFDADIHTAAADAARKHVLVGGKAGLGPDYRGAILALVDASASIDPANWRGELVECPVSAIGPRIVLARGVTIGPSAAASQTNGVNQWIVPGVLRQVAVSESARAGWRRIDPPASQRTFDTALTRGQAVMLAGAV